MGPLLVVRDFASTPAGRSGHREGMDESRTRACGAVTGGVGASVSTSPATIGFQPSYTGVHVHQFAEPERSQRIALVIEA